METLYRSMKLVAVRSQWIASCLLLFLMLHRSQADDPPRITLAPQNKKVVEGGIMSFFCEASGNPSPDLYWRKNGRRIRDNHGRYLMVDMPHKSVLRIEPVRIKSDDGMFDCVADNGIGEPAEVTARLKTYPSREIPIGYPRIVKGPSIKVVEKGRHTVMICSARGTPQPNIYWLKDFIPIDFSDSRLTQLPGGDLQFRDSQESDEAKYECVAENDVGLAYSNSAKLYVRVRRLPPHFSIPPESVEVLPGGDVSLLCIAVGSPMPQVKWRLGDIELTPQDNIPIGKNVLRLTDVTESANYTCVASSELGNIESIAQVKVKILGEVPRNFSSKDVSPTSIQLSWEQPERPQRNGTTVTYEVMYYKQSYPESTFDVNTTNTHLMIEGLEMNTDYLFKIKAHTSRGVGPWSSGLSVHTLGIILPPAPTNIKARYILPTAIKVSWDVSDTTGIIGYSVYYNMYAFPNMDRWQKVEIGTYTVTNIYDLERHTAYAVRVRARGINGYGNFSDIVVTQPTAIFDISGIYNFSFRSLNPRSVMLQWKAPSKPGVLRYKIIYKGGKTYRNELNQETTLPGKIQIIYVPKGERTYYIDGLVPNTVYSFNISALFRDAWGSVNHIQVQTTPDAPPPIQPPESVVTNSQSLLLHLHRASEKHGLITQYLLIVVPEELARIKNPGDFEQKDMGPDASQSAWIAAKFAVDLPEEFSLGPLYEGPTGATEEHINPPLRKEQKYRVFLRAFTTTSKYTDSEFSEPLQFGQDDETDMNGPPLDFWFKVWCRPGLLLTDRPSAKLCERNWLMHFRSNRRTPRVSGL